MQRFEELASEPKSTQGLLQRVVGEYIAWLSVAYPNEHGVGVAGDAEQADWDAFSFVAYCRRLAFPPSTETYKGIFSIRRVWPGAMSTGLEEMERRGVRKGARVR